MRVIFISLYHLIFKLYWHMLLFLKDNIQRFCGWIDCIWQVGDSSYVFLLFLVFSKFLWIIYWDNSIEDYSYFITYLFHFCSSFIRAFLVLLSILLLSKDISYCWVITVGLAGKYFLNLCLHWSFFSLLSLLKNIFSGYRMWRQLFCFDAFPSVC